MFLLSLFLDYFISYYYPNSFIIPNFFITLIITYVYFYESNKFTLLLVLILGIIYDLFFGNILFLYLTIFYFLYYFIVLLKDKFNKGFFSYIIILIFSVITSYLLKYFILSLISIISLKSINLLRLIPNYLISSISYGIIIYLLLKISNKLKKILIRIIR